MFQLNTIKIIHILIIIIILINLRNNIIKYIENKNKKQIKENKQNKQNNKKTGGIIFFLFIPTWLRVMRLWIKLIVFIIPIILYILVAKLQPNNLFIVCAICISIIVKLLLIFSIVMVIFFPVGAEITIWILSIATQILWVIILIEGLFKYSYSLGCTMESISVHSKMKNNSNNSQFAGGAAPVAAPVPAPTPTPTPTTTPTPTPTPTPIPTQPPQAPASPPPPAPASTPAPNNSSFNNLMDAISSGEGGFFNKLCQSNDKTEKWCYTNTDIENMKQKSSGVDPIYNVCMQMHYRHHSSINDFIPFTNPSFILPTGNRGSAFWGFYSSIIILIIICISS